MYSAAPQGVAIEHVDCFAGVGTRRPPSPWSEPEDAAQRGHAVERVQVRDEFAHLEVGDEKSKYRGAAGNARAKSVVVMIIARDKQIGANAHREGGVESHDGA